MVIWNSWGLCCCISVSIINALPEVDWTMWTALLFAKQYKKFNGDHLHSICRTVPLCWTAITSTFQKLLFIRMWVIVCKNVGSKCLQLYWQVSASCPQIVLGIENIMPNDIWIFENEGGFMMFIYAQHFFFAFRHCPTGLWAKVQSESCFVLFKNVVNIS